MLKWLDAREATAAGAALADEFYLQSASKLPRARARDAGQRPQEPELQKFLQKFLQRVDQAARPLKLNVFKRAKLANSFKWRLLEKGVAHELVDELTRALVLRMTGADAGAVAPERGSGSGSRRSAREARSLHATAHEQVARGAFAEARESYQQLVNLDPRDALARNGLGIALFKLSRYEEAEAELRRAIGLRSGYPEAHFNLAAVLQATGRYHESEMPLRRALKLKPAYVNARISLGTTCMHLGRLAEARTCYEKALRAAPRSTQARVGIGLIDSLEGRFTEAEAAYRQALEIEPSASYAWAALVWLRRMTPADSEWVKRAEEIAAGGLDAVNEATLRFAIGKYYDDVGDFGRAFRNYQRANELNKLRTVPYDREDRTRVVNDTVRIFTPEALAPQAGASDSARPVFVVGMPRSGTSLVEQIIASHPEAWGAGELDFWQLAARGHHQEVLDEALRRRLAEDYLKVLTAQSADARRVVDKAPVNTDYLGLIHSVFPNARMIYLRRDPIDTCLSCFFQQFPPAMNYTLDLSDLAHYYREHRRLVDHWRRVLPAATLLEVPYAELVSDQETWSRRILEFIGLAWDERCLEFYRTTRAVNTASVWQVRQKIYKRSVERWRNYEKFIGPLKGLADL
ncbi:MAG TPA: sulfotransferase [Steroidobacteraceae bacterium]|nr:sulfotransferase [Steroidobacteraceae bacterium]